MRLATLLLSLVFVAACSQPQEPSEVTTPISTPGPSVPPGSSTLIGTITERTPQGDRPVGGASVNAWVQTSGIGYSYWWAHGALYADSGGRYELRNLPLGATVQLEVYKPGYVSQCAAPPYMVNGDQQIDAQLVARTNISPSPESVPLSAPGFRLIMGVVYEMTKDGRRPAADAGVDYEPYMDSPAALTYTDAQGRFLLCGIPTTRVATIGTGLGERVVYREVPQGADAVIDIEIP